MGGEDWGTLDANAERTRPVSPWCATVAYTYIGSELTWPIYWEGTLGLAKADLDRASRAISDNLAEIGGSAHVAVLKAIVVDQLSDSCSTPAWLLFKVMKEQGIHEDCISHIYRLFSTQLVPGIEQRLDDQGRIRVDDQELSDAVQGAVKQRLATSHDREFAAARRLRRFSRRLFTHFWIWHCRC